MRWIVGIDVRGRSRGTVQLAAWLRSHLRAASPEFIAVHVVDERIRDSAKIVSEVVAAGERALADAAEHSGVDNPFSAVRVVFGASIEDGLTQAATAAGIDALVIGRIARRDGHSLIRLGSVARRLLRRLPAPIVVVPPDLMATDIGGGAVTLATDLGPTSLEAARFATRLARGLTRDLLVTHVDPYSDVGRDLVGDAAILAAWRPRATGAEVDQWVREHGIPAARTSISEAGVVEGLLEQAKLADAPLLVCGSRRLTATDRLFTSSVGTDLARVADRPVLIVPSA